MPAFFRYKNQLIELFPPFPCYSRFGVSCVDLIASERWTVSAGLASKATDAGVATVCTDGTRSVPAYFQFKRSSTLVASSKF
jgi:hypothetical protein